MGEILRPTLFIGLGDYGQKIIDNLFEKISASQDGLINIIETISISNEGIVCNIKDSTTYELKFDFSSDLFEKNIYQNNFNQFVEKENQIKEIVLKNISQLVKIENTLELRKKGYQIISPQICLFTPFFDQIGSPIIISFLKILKSLSDVNKLPTDIDVNVFGLLSNLSYEQDPQKRLFEDARCYCAFCEFDSTISKVKEQSASRLLTRFVWLLDLLNEEAVSVGSFNDIIPVIVEFNQHLISDTILDKSFSFLLEKKKNGKFNQYSSFGFSKLIFPDLQALDIIKNLGITEVLKKVTNKFQNKKFDRNEIYSAARSFIFKNKFDTIETKLQYDSDKNQIWKNIQFSKSPTLDTNLSHFWEDTDNVIKDFEHNEFNEITKKLSESKEHLLTNAKDSIVTEINEFVDTDKNGLTYVSAFLCTMLAEENIFLEGEPLILESSILTIKEKFKRFYCDILGIYIKESELAKKEEDLKSKERLIEHIEIEIKEKYLKKDDLSMVSTVQHEEDDNKTLNDKDISIIEDSLKEKTDSEIEQLKRNKELRLKEIDNLKIEVNELNFQITNLNNQIEDGSKRRDILEDQINIEHEALLSIKNETEKNEESLKNLIIKIEELYEIRKIVLRKLLYIYPPILFIILALFSVLVWDYSFLPIISIYTIWAAYYYEKNVGKLIRELKEKLKDTQNKKLSLLISYRNKCSQIYKIKYEHLLHSYAIEWIKDLQTYLIKFNENIKSFCKILSYTNIKFNNDLELSNIKENIFNNSVITKDDCIALYEYEKINPENYFNTKEFRPLSYYFHTFVDNNNVDNLVKDISLDIFKRFQKISELSVEDLMIRNNNLIKQVHPKHRIQLLWDCSKSLISINPQGNENTASDIMYLMLCDKDESELPGLISNVTNERLELMPTNDKNQIGLLKLKIGFPAFYVHQLLSCQNSLSDILNKDKSIDKKYFYSDDSEVNYDLFPSSYLMGDENNPNRKLICLAKAFKIIEFRKIEKAFFYENRKIAKDLKELMEFISSIKNEKLKMKIEQDISNMISSDNAQTSLEKYKSINQLEAEDILIIDSVINEKSDL